MSDQDDDLGKYADELRRRFINREPVTMSKTTRRLARQVIAKRDADAQKVMTREEIEAWAEGLVSSMYGKNLDSGDK